VKKSSPPALGVRTPDGHGVSLAPADSACSRRVPLLQVRGRRQDLQGSGDQLVGVRGFEPPAPASRRQFPDFAAVCGNRQDLKNLANNSHFYLITAVHICQDLRIRGCHMVAGNQTATKRGTKMSGGKRIGLREIRALGTNQTIWMARWPDLECGAAREPPWCIS